MPRQAKKGGGGSQTEEERLLLQQRRAQAEEEVTRQREEMLTLFLKVLQLFFPSPTPTNARKPDKHLVLCSQDKLQKDQRNAEVNLLKISDQWRTLLRRTRSAQLRADILVLSQTFEGHVDILDDIIEVRRSQISARQPLQAHQLCSG